MPATRKPLLDLIAADLMSRKLLRLQDEMPLREAAGLLLRSQVGGAPVVDSQGQCIGVLSAVDFLRLVEKHEEVDRLTFPRSTDIERLPDGAVRQFMTPDPVTIRPDTNIRALARMMIDAHIHRLIVVDEDRKPIGVVSSTDLLAALAYCNGER